MEQDITGTDRLRSLLALAATLGMIGFNWLSAAGRLGGGDTGAISDRYPTLVTPAGYSFSIWTLIYFGMIAFSIYQMLPANVSKFRAVRSLYIFSCALNCAWLYFWHSGEIVICFFIILALAGVLLAINYYVRQPRSPVESLLTNAPFGLYFGWVTAAALVNFAIMLKFLNVELTPTAESALAVALILTAALLAVIVRIRFANYLYPVAVAWALTAIAVKQSGQTAVVVAAAAGVITCLIAALSFVMTLNSTTNPR